MSKLPRKILCDFETSGVNHLYDQPLTFSAKVYQDGKEIDSINTKCRMNKSILVSPGALMVNNYSLDCLSKEQSLRDMMIEINMFISKHTPSSIIAFNSSFDYNFSHSHYFQSLTSQNWYQWKNDGNYTVDALELLRAIYVFSDKLHSINILPGKFGFPKFNLDYVSKNNGIFYNAHEAENDVRSLRDLYGLMLHESEEIENLAHVCAIKKEATRIVNDSIFFCSTLGTGQYLKGRALVPLAYNKLKNAVICADLSCLQAHEINSISSWNIFRQCKEQKYGNAFFIVPLNRGKIFFTPEYHEFCKNFGNELTLSELSSRAKKIRKNRYIKNAALEAWLHIDNLYGHNEKTLESTIYSQGFCTPQEAMFINQFNQVAWEDRWSLIESYRSLNSQSRIIKLAKRIVFEQNEELIPDHLRKIYRNHISKKLFNSESDISVPWTNLPKVLNELKDLKSNAINKERLDDLKSYYDDMCNKFAYIR